MKHLILTGSLVAAGCGTDALEMPPPGPPPGGEDTFAMIFDSTAKSYELTCGDLRQGRDVASIFDAATYCPGNMPDSAVVRMPDFAVPNEQNRAPVEKAVIDLMACFWSPLRRVTVLPPNVIPASGPYNVVYVGGVAGGSIGGITTKPNGQLDGDNIFHDQKIYVPDRQHSGIKYDGPIFPILLSYLSNTIAHEMAHALGEDHGPDFDILKVGYATELCKNTVSLPHAHELVEKSYGPSIPTDGKGSPDGGSVFDGIKMQAEADLQRMVRDRCAKECAAIEMWSDRQ